MKNFVERFLRNIGAYRRNFKIQENIGKKHKKTRNIVDIGNMGGVAGLKKIKKKTVLAVGDSMVNSIEESKFSKMHQI